MNNIDNIQFVDFDGVYLPPLWKGPTIVFYPGWSKSKHSGLRRYVFRHEKNTFVYLATRKGQRNGGIDSDTPALTIAWTIPGTAEGTFYNYYVYESDTLWRQSSDNYMEYNAGTQSWEWYVRPNQGANPTPFPFVLSAYSGTTTNLLPDAGTIEQIDWYSNYVVPGGPASTIIYPSFTYNNNSTENLNKWPIRNTDARYNNEPGRPKCITDDLLFKCFQGIPLKPYETVFIEVLWRKYDTQGIRDYGSGTYGFPEGIREFPIYNDEWFTPAPIQIYQQKGLIYRIGKLESDTGIDKYDTVTFAQRTRVLTYKPWAPRSGGSFDTSGALSPIRS